eukprot:6589602-Prymnesium_polylepis.1
MSTPIVPHNAPADSQSSPSKPEGSGSNRQPNWISRSGRSSLNFLAVVAHWLFPNDSRYKRHCRRLTKRLDVLVIHPYSGAKLMFDALIVVAVSYAVFTVPLRFSFAVSLPKWVEALVDVLFLTDIALQFFQGYINSGFPTLDFRKISLRYLRSWFVIDLISSLPYHRFTQATWGKQ